MPRSATPATPRSSYVFGPFRFEPAEHLLLRDGHPVALPPKALDLLAALISSAGHLVTKEDLLKQVWPDTFVEEANLSYTISLLRKALGDDESPHRYIETVPRRGYRFIRQIADLTAGETTSLSETHVERAQPNPSSTFRRRVGVVAIAAVIVLAAAAWLIETARRPGLAARVVPLTTLPGFESNPALSPDGDKVAFSWGGEQQDNVDIYVKIIGSSEVRRLTSSPDLDDNPSWSPDGHQIAFVRYLSTGARIYAISPLGGSDLKLSDFHVASGGIAWSPNSRYIAALGAVDAPVPYQQSNGIYLVPVQGGKPRRLTNPKAPGMDEWPAFSDDGRQLAYIRCARWDGSCDVYVLRLGPTLEPTGPPRRLTYQATWDIWGVAWTRDQRSVIYDTHVGHLAHLWRVNVDGSGPPERIELAGLHAAQPATVSSRDRLAFSELGDDVDVFRFESGRPLQPLLASSLDDSAAQVSHDGMHIAFVSERSGEAREIWLAGADGSNPQQLTHGPGPWQGAPNWSPDDRRIAFDAMGADGRWHIWTIDADGGPPRQVTTGPGEQNVPTWSNDGHWIYFSVDQGAGRQIWRVPATGGTPEQITRRGSGYLARESADGKSLLFQAGFAYLPLLIMPVSGGATTELAHCVQPGAFVERPEGTYYVDCEPRPQPAIHLIDRRTHQDRVLGTLERFNCDADPSLGVSPDGNAFLFSRNVRKGADLMLIENFR